MYRTLLGVSTEFVHVTPFFSVFSRYSNFTHPNMALLNHADGKALALQFLDSLTDGFVVLGGYA